MSTTVVDLAARAKGRVENLDVENLDPEQVAQEAADGAILFCASGGRSALAASTLAQLGYTDVAHLDGGMKAWRNDGRPVVHPDTRRVAAQEPIDT